MTSNQIAFESAMIQKEQNEWTREHNATVMEETKRHNQEMERLQENAVNAQAQANTIQENWNKWQQNWQEEYQAKWREYELAQEDRKIEIQNYLASLEDRKVSAEERYKASMEANLVYQQSLARDTLELDKSFKEWTKTFQDKTYELNAFQAAVRDKEVEYNKAMQHEQNIIASNRNIMQQDYNYALLNFQREQMNRSLINQYDIAKMQNQLNLQLGLANLELQTKKVQAENFQSYSSGLFGRSGIIPGTMSVIAPFTSLAVGGKYGSKITKEIAEQILFK